MPAPTDTQRPNYRDEAKLYYRSKKNIEAKWLDQYGNMSRDNDYQRNRACMGEVFNMLDVVMDICIENFRKTHTITTVDMVGRMPIYTFALEDSDPAKASTGKDSISFSMPTTFARRVRTLRSIGYPISDELLYDTRLLRNETFHGNQTIVLRHLELGYDETMKAFGTVDILINNAGKLSTTPVQQMTIDEWDQVFNVNLTSALLLTQYCEPELKKNKGHIVNIASVAGTAAKWGPIAYCTSKFAMVGMTRAMAREMGPDIHVNGICPGAIQTAMLEGSGADDVIAFMKATAPLQRVGQGREIATACLFFSTEDSSFVTGQLLRVDGGVDA